jgi:hypothetical protein
MTASAFAVPTVTSAAVNYFDKTTTVTKSMSAAEVENQPYGTTPIWIKAACPSGYRVTGGGYSASTAPDVYDQPALHGGQKSVLLQ